ncbi:MAG TPA: BLUF domain-containing protein [Planctomicrobium sp.]|nr:BLUF domain-containing protein [Planctomicrobium sp.]
MLQIIYKSLATVPFSNAGLSRLLMTSRVQNQIVDITGILVVHSNAFLQVLEGPEEAVEATFERIVTDPRHKCLQVLSREIIEERAFPNWSMGLVCTPGGRFELNPGLDELFHSKGSFPRGTGSHVLRLLQEFRCHPWRRKVDIGYAPLVAR